MILQFSGIQNRHGCSLPLSIWHNSDIGFEWFWSPTQSYLEVSKNEGSPILQVRPFKYIETWKTPGDLWIPRTPPNLPPRPPALAAPRLPPAVCAVKALGQRPGDAAPGEHGAGHRPRGVAARAGALRADVCPWALTNGSPAIQGGDDHSLLMLVDVRWVVLWYVSLLGELKCCVSSVNSLR